MELTGNGFTLRKWRPEDARPLQKHADNVNISSFLTDRFPSPYTLQHAESHITLKMAEEPVTNFCIEIEGEAAGVIGIDMRADIYRKTPLLGYWVAEEHQGKGIAAEAVKLITGYGFANLDIICIQATVLSKNPKSMRVLEKAGFEKQGILRQAVIKNNEVYDEHVFAVYREQSR